MTIHDCELDPLNGILYYQGRKLGGVSGSGYNVVRMTKGVRKHLHRLIYEFTKGPISEGLVIDHIDGNPLNNVPWNLQAITQSANVLRGKCGRGDNHHHIYKTNNGKYSVQVKHKGPQRRFENIEAAIEYRDLLLSK